MMSGGGLMRETLFFLGILLRLCVHQQMFLLLGTEA